MNDPTEILTYLPKLPCVARTDDIAHDTGQTRIAVERAIQKLRDDEYRIVSQVADGDVCYGLSFTSWERACEASRRWMESQSC